ncbi:MAG: IPTL-CTERM sorting domain-containing protein [Bacteroidetes bacterium]|nr:IPTL-CTERM sorting domain-containing protein [Bacteroidota bacterium]
MIKFILGLVMILAIVLANSIPVKAGQLAKVTLKNTSAAAANDVHLTAAAGKSFKSGTAPGFNPASQAPAGGSHNLDWTSAQNVTPIPPGGSIVLPVEFMDPWGGINKDSCYLTLNGVPLTTKVTYLPVSTFISNSLPSNGPYKSLAGDITSYSNGFLLRNITHDNFSSQQAPPPPGGTYVQSFSSSIHMEVSTNGGSSWQPMSANANVTVRVHNNGAGGSTGFFDTEMLQLDISGGTLPGGVMIRESPTLQSLGQTSITQVTGGYMIDSFFDIFTELTTDGGQSWTPSGSSTNMYLDTVATTSPIPTLSQWGLIIFALLLLATGAWLISKRQKIRMA